MIHKRTHNRPPKGQREITPPEDQQHAKLTASKPVDPDVVFDAVEQDRDSNEASKNVTTASIRYQASASHPGYLEQIDESGKRRIGTFRNGVFVPDEENLD